MPGQGVQVENSLYGRPMRGTAEARSVAQDDPSGSVRQMANGALSPPAHNLVHALVRDAELPRQLRLGNAGSVPGGGEGVAYASRGSTNGTVCSSR